MKDKVVIKERIRNDNEIGFSELLDKAPPELRTMALWEAVEGLKFLAREKDKVAIYTLQRVREMLRSYSKAEQKVVGENG